jgi:hypothetical protein
MIEKRRVFSESRRRRSSIWMTTTWIRNFPLRIIFHLLVAANAKQVEAPAESIHVVVRGRIKMLSSS